MSAQVFMPAVPRWLIATAAGGWLALTALGVLLRPVDGFVPEMAASLSSTAAGILLGVTGVGALLEGWRKRQMRQRTGPFVVAAMNEAIEAYGRLLACYTRAGSSVLPGASAVAPQHVSTLLSPPLTEDRDLLPFRVWKGEALTNFLRIRGERLEAATINDPDQDREQEQATPTDHEDGVGRSTADGRLVETMRQQLATYEAAATGFQDAIARLVDFDPPGLAPLFEQSLEVRSTVVEQTAALNDADEQHVAAQSWYACHLIMGSAVTIAIATDSMFRSVRKLSGRRMNPLQLALQGAEAMQQLSKVVILANVSAAQTHESFVASMAAADEYSNRPEARARRERIEKYRARRRLAAQEAAASPREHKDEI